MKRQWQPKKIRAKSSLRNGGMLKSGKSLMYGGNIESLGNRSRPRNSMILRVPKMLPVVGMWRGPRQVWNVE